MKSRVFASPQLHQSAAGVGLFNELISLGQISDERDVAAAAEYRSVRELRIACRADHDAGKFTTAGNTWSAYSGGALSTTSRTISFARASSSGRTKKSRVPSSRRSARDRIRFSFSASSIIQPLLEAPSESSPDQTSTVASSGYQF